MNEDVGVSSRFLRQYASFSIKVPRVAEKKKYF